MQRYQPPMIALAVCLAALAGFVDALAYSSLGGFFASFMSGNTTRLGVSFATARYDEVRMAGALILSFVSGVMIATVIARRWPSHQRVAVMGTVTLLLGVAAAVMRFHPQSQALLLLAAAMGVENGLFTREGEVSIGLTYMTGSLVRMAQRLAGALMGDSDRWTWLRYLLLWLGFLLGVVTGARCYGAYDNSALWLATGAAGVLTIAVWAIAGREDKAGPWGPRAD
ncbi:MAG: YoaK family protein [Sphingomonas sp.]